MSGLSRRVPAGQLLCCACLQRRALWANTAAHLPASQIPFLPTFSSQHPPVMVRKPRLLSSMKRSLPGAGGDRYSASISARFSDPTDRMRLQTSPLRVPRW